MGTALDRYLVNSVRRAALASGPTRRTRDHPGWWTSGNWWTCALGRSTTVKSLAINQMRQMVDLVDLFPHQPLGNGAPTKHLGDWLCAAGGQKGPPGQPGRSKSLQGNSLMVVDLAPDQVHQRPPGPPLAQNR